MDLIESVSAISERVNWHELSIPPPPDSVKSWPLVGEEIHRIWTLAATNTRELFSKIYPYLKPVGSVALGIAAGTGTSVLKFIISVIVAGFLFVSAPPLVKAMKMLARKLEAERGEQFVSLAGATIRTVSRGVVGIAVLQALLAGIGLAVAGIPAASLLTFVDSGPGHHSGRPLYSHYPDRDLELVFDGDRRSDPVYCLHGAGEPDR